MPPAKSCAVAFASARLQFGLAFCAVDCRVRRRVDDRLRAHAPHRRDDRIGIGEIERRAIERNDLPIRREYRAKLEADLAAGAREENRRPAHGYASAKASKRPAESLAASVGAEASGHAIASAGSLHKSVRSNSGYQ